MSKKGDNSATKLNPPGVRDDSDVPVFDPESTFSGVELDIGTAHLPNPALQSPSEDAAPTLVLPRTPATSSETASQPSSTLHLASSSSNASSEPVDRKTATEFRANPLVAESPLIGLRSSPIAGGGGESPLKESEILRIAQARIEDLEREIDRLRRENERMSAAGDALRRRADELGARAESLESQMREASKARDEEEKVFRSQIASKEREASEQRAKIEELQHRLDFNFKKIRERERMLEHRIEIMKIESATLASAKDKALLDLRRQIDQLSHDAEQAKSRSQEMYGQFREKQETVRRVVRALRIALTMLEGEDDAGGSGKQG